MTESISHEDAAFIEASAADVGAALDAEGRNVEKVSERSRLEELKVAFKRASELRDKPFREYKIKNGAGKVTHSRVLVTNDERSERGKLYVRVLIPYSEIERRNARSKFVEIGAGERVGLPHKRRGLHLDVHYHEQWVSEGKLKAI